MNEIERLIRHLPRPAPSQQLDERMSSLVSRTGRNRPRQPVFSRLRTVATTAACAGLVGFLAGRQSAGEANRPALAPKARESADPGAVVSRPTASTNVAAVDPEAMARFVMPRNAYVSLFGTSPLEERPVAGLLE